MHQEGRAAIHVTAQQAQPFVSGVPGFHNDVVQFIPQKIFDYAFKSWLDLEKVGQHSCRSQSTPQPSRLKQSPHRFS